MSLSCHLVSRIKLLLCKNTIFAWKDKFCILEFRCCALGLLQKPGYQSMQFSHDSVTNIFTVHLLRILLLFFVVVCCATIEWKHMKLFFISFSFIMFCRSYLISIVLFTKTNGCVEQSLLSGRGQCLLSSQLSSDISWNVSHMSSWCSAT